MSMSMYQASVPVFVRALSNLLHVLKKGEEYAKSRNAATELLVQSRLYFDMFPLVKQVQIATDMAKNGAARLAGVDPLKFEDNEATMEELYARIERALEYIKGFTPAQIDGGEARPITLKQRNGVQHFSGEDYLRTFVLPNLFFHCTTAYNILRVAGTPIGKSDFIKGAD
jgi:hypothetical protein